MSGELSLGEILKLVGHLDDQPGERFRRFLREEVTSVGQLQDYIRVPQDARGPVQPGPSGPD